MSKRSLLLVSFLFAWLGAGRAASAAITATPPTVAIGDVVVGKSDTGMTTLNLNGSSDVLVNVVTDPATGDQCTDFTVVGPTQPFRIGDSPTVTIQFAPQSPGAVHCTLDVVANSNPTTIFASFAASGNGLAPMISLDPPAVDFGHVDVNHASTQPTPLTATNNGTSDLTITSASFTAGGTEFSAAEDLTQTVVVPKNGGKFIWHLTCTPNTAGQRSGTFRITSDAFGAATVNVSLTCFGDQGVLTVVNDPPSNDFGTVQINLAQPLIPTATVTIRNDGNVQVTGITGAVAPSDKGYSVLSVAQTTLIAGATTTATVQFKPLDTNDGGAASATFKGSWGTGRTATSTPAYTLAGSPANVTLDNTTVAFGSFRFDQGVAKTFKITNSGPASVTLAPPTFTSSGNFTNDVLVATTPANATSIAANGSVTVTLTPQPTHTGPIDGQVTFSITDTGTPSRLVVGAPSHVNVTGTSTSAQIASTPTIDFQTVDVASAGATKLLTISNTGDGPLDLTTISLTATGGGAAPAAFSITKPTLPLTIAAHTQRDIPINYKPTSARAEGDPETATVIATVAGVLNGTPSTMLSALQGRGIDGNLSVAAPPMFPPTFRNPGDKAPIGTVTITNIGEAPLQILGAAITGDPAFQLVGSTDAVMVPPGGTLAFQVKFSPTTVGSPAGLLTVTGAGNHNATAQLKADCPPRQIAFGPSTINLGITSVGVPLTTASLLALSNMDPSTTFHVTRIDLTGDTAIQIANDVDALAPGSTQNLAITFTPTSVATFQVTAKLFIDEDPEPQATVTITGDSVFAAAHGGGGCNTGAGRGSLGGALLLGFAALAARRRPRRRWQRLAGIAIAGAAMLAIAATVRADGIGIAVFEPTPATTGAGFALQPADVGPSGSLVANAVVSYASNPLVIDTVGVNGMTTSAPVKHSTLMQLGLAYALLDRLELGARVPIYQQSGDSSATSQPAKGTALGDIAVHGRLRLARADLGLGQLVAGVSAVVVLPTASKNQFTGSDQPEGRLLALGAFTPVVAGGRLSVSVNLGPVIRGKSQYANIVEKSGIAWGAGASVRLLDPLWATAELFGETTPSGEQHEAMAGAAPPSVALSPVEALVGVVYKQRAFSIGGAFGRGITSAVGTPDWRGVVSLSFAPGAIGASTGPTHSELDDRDTDGDGIPDSIDKCPTEPEDKDMFEDQDGCPDPDNDHDGVPDTEDKCPLDPEDRDGFQDADGCPDKDNDGDGIPDSMDKCPNEPEDKDGFQDLDGCPDPDNDGDGIPDDRDKCPNEPETINGFQDDDGCPDKGDSTIILSPDRIETLDPIQFNGVKLTKASNPLLGQVAATLRAHIEIVRLRITVHVQPSKDPAADQARSDKRAQAVREWLVQWGIAATRLEVRGFGGTKPLVPPDQKGAPKINDRLELIILERK